MTKQRRALACLLATTACASAVYFEPTCRVRGWLGAEAFFDGRPTCWWRAELDHWEIHVQAQKDGRRKPFVSYHRNYSWFDGLRERWWPQDRDGGLIKPQESPVLGLLKGGSEAEAVLQALYKDRSQKIRQFARVGLGLDAEESEVKK